MQDSKVVKVDFNGWLYQGFTDGELDMVNAGVDKIINDHVTYKSFSDAVAAVFSYWRSQGYAVQDPAGFEDMVVGIGLKPILLDEDFAVFTL